MENLPLSHRGFCPSIITNTPRKGCLFVLKEAATYPMKLSSVTLAENDRSMDVVKKRNLHWNIAHKRRDPEGTGEAYRYFCDR